MSFEIGIQGSPEGGQASGIADRRARQSVRDPQGFDEAGLGIRGPVAQDDFARRLRAAKAGLAQTVPPVASTVSPLVQRPAVVDRPVTPAPDVPSQHGPIVRLAQAIVRRLPGAPECCAFDVVVNSLGRVRIRVRREAGRLHIRLRATRAATRVLVSENADALRSALLAHGYPSEIETGGSESDASSAPDPRSPIPEPLERNGRCNP